MNYYGRENAPYSGYEYVLPNYAAQVSPAGLSPRAAILPTEFNNPNAGMMCRISLA